MKKSEPRKGNFRIVQFAYWIHDLLGKLIRLSYCYKINENLRPEKDAISYIKFKRYLTKLKCIST